MYVDQASDESVNQPPSDSLAAFQKWVEDAYKNQKYTPGTNRKGQDKGQKGQQGSASGAGFNKCRGNWYPPSSGGHDSGYSTGFRPNTEGNGGNSLQDNAEQDYLRKPFGNFTVPPSTYIGRALQECGPSSVLV